MFWDHFANPVLPLNHPFLQGNLVILVENAIRSQNVDFNVLIAPGIFIFAYRPFQQS